MSKKIASVRGMHDILPDESGKWQKVESAVSSVLIQYCYSEIRFPILEATSLFKRSVGEVTDIVEKEMYSFEDRNGESLTLRPEGTAGCVRAAEQHGLLYNQIQRFWYKGPMFRYERPQKGRARQFHQMAAEVFGISDVGNEIELITLSARFFANLNLLDRLKLEINTIGDSKARADFSQSLLDYLQKHKVDLDEDSQKRMSSNPLRILDSKDSGTQSILKNAPRLYDYLSKESKERFEQLQMMLQELNIEFHVNPNLVRGLDYYNDTVFEWVSEDLGAQATVCAGGRYDTLVEKLGGKATPAAGFGMGMERLILLLDTLNKLPLSSHQANIFIAPIGEDALLPAQKLAEQIRDRAPEIAIMLNGVSGLKSQLKKADKSGAQFGLILGESELEANKVQLKFLREKKEPELLGVQELLDFLVEVF